MNQIVFKVLRRDSDGLSSVIIPDDNQFCLRYRPNEIIRPLVGGIFVFKTYEDAKRFSFLGANRQEIWEGEAINCKEISCVLDARDYFTKGSLYLIEDNAAAVQEWWTETKSDGYCIRSAPVGSLICEALTLTKKIT